jgi:hypothetical protein
MAVLTPRADVTVGRFATANAMASWCRRIASDASDGERIGGLP